MQLEKISLLNFKNYPELSLEFSPHINSIVGANGSGKTNLLDAIYYLSLTKSAFNNVDAQNILHNQAFFMIKGAFKLPDKKVEIQCKHYKGQKKSIQYNKKNYEKISDHIGKLPVVLIAPNDTDIIREGSEFRRKFFDGILAQLKTTYLNHILKYQQLMRQRNALLKQFYEKNFFDKDLITPYDNQLLDTANLIHEERKNFIIQFQPVFTSHYQFLTDSKEVVNLEYQSELASNEFTRLFFENTSRDIQLQRTTMGIHKDDYNFIINGYPLKKFGSQGQQKSFVVALKLAQFDFLKEKKGFKPILLLDDIFDKLDEKRINKLTVMLDNNTFGQLFITDARPERMDSLFKKRKGPVKFFHIEAGQVTKTYQNS